MKGLASIASIACGALVLLALAGCGDDVRLERRTITYPNGKGVKEDWTFARMPNGDTLEQGVHKKFFWNGNPSESVMWKMGKRNGSAQAWYENGSSKWQKSYDNGKKVGTWRLFYADGRPWIAADFDEDKLQGKVRVWGKNGGDPQEAQFDHGACKSGDCDLLDLPAAPPGATAVQKIEANRKSDIIKDFLDQD